MVLDASKKLSDIDTECKSCSVLKNNKSDTEEFSIEKSPLFLNSEGKLVTKPEKENQTNKNEKEIALVIEKYDLITPLKESKKNSKLHGTVFF